MILKRIRNAIFFSVNILFINSILFILLLKDFVEEINEIKNLETIKFLKSLIIGKYIFWIIFWMLNIEHMFDKQ